MTKLFISLFLAVGLISVHISSAKPSGKKSSPVDTESDDDSTSDTEENPAMSCLLFGDKGCHIECDITSRIFKYYAHGTCDANQKCCCHNSYGDETFHDMWQKTFDDEYVYRKITDDDQAYNQAAQIFFDSPFQTAEEFKEHLSPIISPYQLSRLETNDKHYAAKYTKDGKFDVEALRKYVVEKLEKHLQTKSGKSLLNMKYKEKFRKALENSESSKATVYNFTFRVEQLQNKTLENILEEYLKTKNIEKPKIEIPVNKNRDINAIVEYIVLNELMKRIEEKGKNSPKSATAAKKPATNRATRNQSAKKSP